VRVRGAELQPEGALPLLEPAELLAGDPVVAAPLQLWQAGSGAELAQSPSNPRVSRSG